MRVTGGSSRGRRLKVPKGRAVRPTAARVKEALFNILAQDLSGVRVLDLFAGSGNVSIEALSRGAEEAVLVDASGQSGRVIMENLRRFGLANRGRLLNTSAERALRQLRRRGESFDLIFIDPPYRQGLVERTLKIIAQGSILRAQGLVVAEHSTHDRIDSRYGDLALRDRRRYGDTVLSFFEWMREKSVPREGTE